LKKAALLLIVAFSVALVIHILFDRTRSSLFVYAGFPGMMGSLFITGGHGGTIAQERLAPVVELAINTVCYSVVLLCTAKLSKRLRS
jgi:hypothetical protein